MLKLEQVRRLKEVLRATSAPLSFESFSEFAGAVLNPLIELMQVSGGNLYITDVALSQKPLFLWHTHDRELVTQYQTRYFKQSPLHVMIPRGVRVGQTCEYVDYDRFTDSVFYNEFLAPRRIHHMAALIARLPEQGKNAGSLGVIGLQREPSAEAFSSEDLEILDLLYNPVEGALHTLLLAGNEREQLEQTFQTMPVAVMVLDWKLREVYSNPKFSNLFQSRALSELERAEIAQAAANTRDHYVAPSATDPAPSRPVQIERNGQRASVRLTVLPEGLMSARPHLLCIFEEQGPLVAQPNRERLKLAFELTDREADVVTQCLLGLTNSQIASHLGMSPETVKHHLKRIFQKTGVHRRSQLASMLPRG